MKNKKDQLKNKTLTKTPEGKKNRKTRIETTYDESNKTYYDILNPKYDIKNERDLELLLKEIEFYKLQIKAERNINKSLNKEISHFNEIQKLGEIKSRDIRFIEEITVLEKKNKFLEEYVFKLKDVLDKANVLFPNFLEKLQKENENNNDIEMRKDNNINKICLTENNEENNNLIEKNKLIEENKKLNNRVRELNDEIDKLRYKKEIKNDESFIMNKMEEYYRQNNTLIKENAKLKEYINKINILQEEKENFLKEINNLKEIIKQKELDENLEKNKKEENIDNEYKKENIKLNEKKS